MKNPVITLLIAVVLFAISGCNPVDRQAQMDALLDHNFFCPQPEIPDSVVIDYFEDGLVFSEVRFHGDNPTGLSRFYHPNGQLMRSMQYCNGRPHGPHRTYFEDGSINSRGYYWNGEMTGLWIYYFPNGNIRERVTFSENLEHGPFEEYYADGTLQARGFYVRGENEHGFLYLYHEDGSLKRKMRCNIGICVTISS